MVIDYKKFPIIGMLEQDVFNVEKCQIKTFNYSDDIRNFLPVIVRLIKGWTGFVKEVRDNITFISETYYQCMKRSWKSFALINLIEAIKPSSGVLIFKSENGRWIALIYIIKSVLDMQIICLYDCDTLLFTAKGSYDDLYCIHTVDEGVYSGITPKNAILNTVNVIIGYLLMERYAKIETITCEGKSKIKNDKIKKRGILNYTGLPIKFRDSTWFTTIYRNEGFKVRGHFRLQPKKNDKGEWIKELIYINEFEKHGYHRQAKMLNYNQDKDGIQQENPNSQLRAPQAQG